MTRPIRALAVLCLAFASIFVPATASAGDPCFHEMDNRPPTTSGVTSQIAIGDCVFAPTVSRVPVGTTVTWRNTSFQGHEVVGSNLTWGAHDKVLEMGDTIGWTFAAPGVYAYSCMIHPGMTGAIIVGDVASASTGGGVTESSAEGSRIGDDGEGGAGTGLVGPIAVGGSLLAIAGLGFLVLRRRAAEGQV